MNYGISISEVAEETNCGHSSAVQLCQVRNQQVWEDKIKRKVTGAIFRILVGTEPYTVLFLSLFPGEGNCFLFSEESSPPVLNTLPVPFP